MTSTGRWGAPASTTEVNASSTIATPALQSPPKMVEPSERRTSPSSWGLMPRPGSTVSRCADRITGSPCPSSRAMTLRKESWFTENPRSRSRDETSRSISSSSPVGLSILIRSINVSTSRSRFAMPFTPCRLFGGTAGDYTARRGGRTLRKPTVAGRLLEKRNGWAARTQTRPPTGTSLVHIGKCPL